MCFMFHFFKQFNIYIYKISWDNMKNILFDISNNLGEIKNFKIDQSRSVKRFCEYLKISQLFVYREIQITFCVS